MIILAFFCNSLGMFIFLFNIKYSSIIPCRAFMVTINSFNLFLPWKVFVSPSSMMVLPCILGWVDSCKLTWFEIYLPIYSECQGSRWMANSYSDGPFFPCDWYFFLTAFNTYLFCIVSATMMLWHREVYFLILQIRHSVSLLSLDEHLLDLRNFLLWFCPKNSILLAWI